MPDIDLEHGFSQRQLHVNSSVRENVVQFRVTSESTHEQDAVVTDDVLCVLRFPAYWSKQNIKRETMKHRINIVF